MTRRAVAAFLWVIAAALALRCGDLAERPLHNDEAINAFKLQGLWQEGRYVYDPHEYHGPVLYYAALPVLTVAAWLHPEQPTEASMRAVTVVFGLGLVVLGWLLRREVGGEGVVLPALLTAVSPAMVFYSRYFIHEVPLVFFTALALIAGWRYCRSPGRGWAMLTGAAVGLMYATKETFVFCLVAATVGVAGALFLAWWDERRLAGAGQRNSRPRLISFARAKLGGAWCGAHLTWALVAAVLVAEAFYTSFFTNARGPMDGLRTYLTWFGRAEGATPHVHDWGFYWARLGWFHQRGGPRWSEGLILILGAMGMVVACRGTSATRRHPVPAVGWYRFLVGYTLALGAIYSVIPYKTPWCLLGFYHGWIWLAGLGIWGLWRRWETVWPRAVLAMVLVSGGAHLGWQAWQSSRSFAADFRNPYVYGHTSADLTNLLGTVAQLERVAPEGRRTALQVMAPDSAYWPLPWYWRKWERAGWYDQAPDGPAAPLVVAASKLKLGLEERTQGAWIQAGLYELRPRYFVELYVEATLWKRYLAARAAEPAGP